VAGPGVDEPEPLRNLAERLPLLASCELPCGLTGAPAEYRADGGGLGVTVAAEGQISRPWSPASPALLASGVVKRFGGRPVLDGVDLEARSGEVVGLVGENGAGKSTLLRICAGLIVPDAGRVRVSGRVGFCPQEPGLLDLLTADEHLVYFGAALGLGRAAAVATGRRLLEEFGYPVTEGKLTKRLSGGTRQKLNLALALLGDPEVLLLDEPYQGFDRGVYVNF